MSAVHSSTDKQTDWLALADYLMLGDAFNWIKSELQGSSADGIIKQITIITGYQN